MASLSLGAGRPDQRRPQRRHARRSRSSTPSGAFGSTPSRRASSRRRCMRPRRTTFLAGLQPVGRMGETQDIVDAVLYLETAALRHRRDPARRRRRSRRPLVSADDVARSPPDRPARDRASARAGADGGVRHRRAGRRGLRTPAASARSVAGPCRHRLAAKTIAELRALTSKPINVNFFCHAPAKADAGRERAWHDRLSPYYRALGIEPEPPPSRLDLAAVRRRHVQGRRGRQAGGGELPFRLARAGAAGPGQGGGLPGHGVGDDGGGGALAGSAWRRCGHRPGL